MAIRSQLSNLPARLLDVPRGRLLFLEAALPTVGPAVAFLVIMAMAWFSSAPVGALRDIIGGARS